MALGGSSESCSKGQGKTIDEDSIPSLHGGTSFDRTFVSCSFFYVSKVPLYR